MAYLPLTDEERRRQEALSLSPASAPDSGAAPSGGAPAPASPTPRQEGTGYVNLQRYLELNRPGAQGMADTLASGVETKAKAAEDALSGAQSAFAQESEAGRLTYDRKRATSSDEAARLAAQGYAGPDSLAAAGGGKYSRLGAQVDAAGQAAQQVGTWGGRQTLLQDTYGRGASYSPGAQRFDNALASQASGSRFDTLRSLYGGLTDSYGQAEKAAADKVGQYRAEALDAAPKYAALVEPLRQEEARRAREEAARRREEQLRRQRERMVEQRHNKGRPNPDDEYYGFNGYP